MLAAEKAYKILLERHINDDRLVAERITIFLLSSSILFLGFAMLVEHVPPFLRPLVPILGLFLCVLAVFAFTRTKLALEFWRRHEKEIEKESSGACFVYMWQNKMSPHLVDKHIGEAKLCWLPVGWLLKRITSSFINAYIFPAIFMTLWGFMLWWAFSYSD